MGPTQDVRAGRRIVLATHGSLGDLHPFLALAKGVQARGHEPVVATNGHHRERVERQGVGFHPVGTDLNDWEVDRELYRKAMDRRTGSKFVMRELILPHLRRNYDDLLVAVRGADL